MYCCKECAYLDKSKKIFSDNKKHYKYGCRNARAGFMCGWIDNDNELAYMGCSAFKEKAVDQQLSFLEQ